MLTDTELKAMIEDAAERGRYAGRAAGSWVTDGNTTRETAERLRAGIEEGDPMIMDLFHIPNLSGEWADGETPRSLAESVGLDPDGDDGDDTPEVLDEICSAWEEAAGEAFMAEVERSLAAMLDK